MLRRVLLKPASAAITDAGIVGNFAGGLFTRQLRLGTFLTEGVGPGIPVATGR